MSKQQNDQDRLSALIASVNDDMFGENGAREFTDNSVRVERILLEMVRPDPVQPRRVLPEQLHHKFHNQQLTPSQALRELVKLAQVSARQQSRPFSNVLELLPDADSDDELPANLSPEEETLRDLVTLAVTIRDDGQVNPLTVVDVSQGVARQFRIETGERRYWAAWLLRDFVPGYESDGMVDCIVVPAEASSAFRQAKENTARKGLNAIAMARQAALLLLTVHDYDIPDHAVTNDFYRQALDLDLRGKREYTDAVLSSMGGIGRRQFSRYKALLRLGDEAIEMADQNNLEEGLLRHITSLNPPEQVEVIHQIIQFNLTRKQIKNLIDDSEKPTKDDGLIPKPILQLARIMKSKELPNPQQLARYLFSQDENVIMARARLQNLRRLIDEAEKYLPE